MSMYATLPTPVYNTPERLFEKDTQGLIKSIETIALPRTKFTIKAKIRQMYQVETVDYPSSGPLYVDPRFLFSEGTPREKKLPSIDQILNFMQSLVGVRYFWGGNWAQGIPEMADFYPDIEATDDLLCKGVDCSGLLYQATNGFTPRNTAQLFTYGQEIELKNVKPLDMMVWKGHVLFVLNSSLCIESVAGQGVILSNFIERYTYFRDRLQIENKPFSLRRWHPVSLLRSI